MRLALVLLSISLTAGCFSKPRFEGSIDAANGDDDGGGGGGDGGGGDGGIDGAGPECVTDLFNDPPTPACGEWGMNYGEGPFNRSAGRLEISAPTGLTVVCESDAALDLQAGAILDVVSSDIGGMPGVMTYLEVDTASGPVRLRHAHSEQPAVMGPGLELVHNNTVTAAVAFTSSMKFWRLRAEGGLIVGSYSPDGTEPWFSFGAGVVSPAAPTKVRFGADGGGEPTGASLIVESFRTCP